MSTTVPRPVPLDAPDDLRHPELRKATTEYKRTFRQWRESAAEAEALVAGRSEAIAQDRESYATALSSGKPDPGEKFTREHDALVHDARRKAEALAVVAERSWGELAAAVDANRTKARAASAKRNAAAWSQLGGAVAAVEEAMTELRASAVEAAFLDDGPRSRAAKVSVLTRFPLPGPNGEPYMSEAVLEGLRVWSTRPAVDPPRAPLPETGVLERSRALGAT